MQLWNVMQQEKVYEFTMTDEVESVVQSPVVDHVAVGLKDGTIMMVNLLYDEVLFTFKQREGSILTTSFLTDTNLGLSLMASACKHSGTIVLWDLNAQKIWAELKVPHNARNISSLAFIANEPVLVTASEDDNSIKMWLFEKGQALPRLLKERCGHAEAPHKIRFYGGLDDPTMQGARNLLTCSKDGNLRDISLLNEFQSMNFSKKKQLRSIEDGLQSGSVKSFDFSQFRERDWSNVLTCHSSDDQQTS